MIEVGRYRGFILWQCSDGHIEAWKSTGRKKRDKPDEGIPRGTAAGMWNGEDTKRIITKEVTVEAAIKALKDGFKRAKAHKKIAPPVDIKRQLKMEL